MATKKPQRPAAKVQRPAAQTPPPANETGTGAPTGTPDAPTAPEQQPGTEVQPPAAKTATGAPPEATVVQQPAPAAPPAVETQKAALVLYKVCTTRVPGGKRIRAGIQFGTEPIEVNFDDLTEDQIAAITADPHLKVTPV